MKTIFFRCDLFTMKTQLDASKDITLETKIEAAESEVYQHHHDT